MSVGGVLGSPTDSARRDSTPNFQENVNGENVVPNHLSKMCNVVNICASLKMHQAGTLSSRPTKHYFKRSVVTVT